MRELDGQPALSPLESAELWQDTRSTQARQALDRLGLAMPPSTLGDRHRPN
jgi:hypothetical protein